MDYILLIVGFALLVKGADVFVDGSSAIARYFKIPAFIIGLTIVAFGTSAPEAAVSITAAAQGQNGIAVGNVLGSNLFNLLVVLGACALIKPCPVAPPVLKGEYPLSIFAALLFVILAVTSAGMGGGMGLSRIDGLILLALFVFFLLSTVAKSIKNPAPDPEGGVGRPSLPKGILFAVIGLAAVIFGGQLVVDKASTIASSFGISQTLIGLTIVAIGTSLPELVTSIAAARKGETDIAVGNVIGSNLFNLLFVLGVSVTVHPVRVDTVSVYDACILIAASLLTMLPAISKKEIRRGWGIVFILLYLVYSCYIIAR